MRLNGILGSLSLQAPPNKRPQVLVSQAKPSKPTIHFLEVVSISGRDPVAPLVKGRCGYLSVSLQWREELAPHKNAAFHQPPCNYRVNHNFC